MSNNYAVFYMLDIIRGANLPLLTLFNWVRFGRGGGRGQRGVYRKREESGIKFLSSLTNAFLATHVICVICILCLYLPQKAVLMRLWHCIQEITTPIHANEKTPPYAQVLWVYDNELQHANLFFIFFQIVHTMPSTVIKILQKKFCSFVF